MGEKLTIEEMKDIAISKGGKFLSEKYINSKTLHLWECKEGHQFWAKPEYVKEGSSWCKKCSGQFKRNIEEMQQIAKSRGGKCLSEIYVDNKKDLEWECADEHRWKSRPNSIKSGQWCPVCEGGVGEKITRFYFENIFRKKFSKVRPKWLISPKGKPLELDGYCEELNLAFEYQGPQHFKPHKVFSKNQSLKERKEYDAIKNEICNKRGVQLISINYSINNKEILDQIIEQLKKLKIDVEIPLEISGMDVSEAYSNSKIRKMQELAKKKNGLCLSTKYVNNKLKLIWQCEKGHVFELCANDVTSGHWCPKCAYLIIAEKNRGNIQEMRNIALQRGGKCLSDIYVDSKTKLNWQCGKYHEWAATPASVKSGQWCGLCGHERTVAKRRLGLEKMQKLAASYGGVCLSTEYSNSHKILKWRCKECHEFERSPRIILRKNGSWCSICLKEEKKKF